MGRKWTEAEVKEVISLWAAYFNSLNGNRKNCPLYTAMAKEFNDNLNPEVKVVGADINAKITNLRRQYR